MNTQENYTLITGASGGLGLELAKIFSREGHNLVLLARRHEKLESLAKELEENYKIKTKVIAKDLCLVNASQEVYDYCQRENIHIDILVNNAGFGDFGPYAESDWTKQANMVQLNITALMHLTHLFLPPMLERKEGKILNLASVAAFQPGPLMSIYYASKAFVLSFTEALSVETKGTGVTVTALCPGPTESDFMTVADLEESGLFKNLRVASAQTVCEYGYRQMQKGKVIAIPGLLNKILVLTAKFSPRALVRLIVLEIQKAR